MERCDGDLTCQGGQCVRVTTVTVPPVKTCSDVEGNGIIYSDSSCQNATLCDNGNIVSNFSCNVYQYLDPELGCIASPPTPCTGSCTDGFCPDKLDCSGSYFCESGKPVFYKACPDGYLYDSALTPPACVLDDGTIKCPVTEECDYEYIFTTVDPGTVTTASTPSDSPNVCSDIS